MAGLRGSRQRRRQVRHVATGQRMVGRPARVVPGGDRGGDAGGAAAVGADRGRDRGGPVRFRRRNVNRLVLPASGRPDAAGGVRGGFGEVAGSLVSGTGDTIDA